MQIVGPFSLPHLTCLGTVFPFREWAVGGKGGEAGEQKDWIYIFIIYLFLFSLRA